jgi:hypothetical protein
MYVGLANGWAGRVEREEYSLSEGNTDLFFHNFLIIINGQ